MPLRSSTSPSSQITSCQTVALILYVYYTLAGMDASVICYRKVSIDVSTLQYQLVSCLNSIEDGGMIFKFKVDTFSITSVIHEAAGTGLQQATSTETETEVDLFTKTAATSVPTTPAEVTPGPKTPTVADKSSKSTVTISTAATTADSFDVVDTTTTEPVPSTILTDVLGMADTTLPDVASTRTETKPRLSTTTDQTTTSSPPSTAANTLSTESATIATASVPSPAQKTPDVVDTTTINATTTKISSDTSNITECPPDFYEVPVGSGNCYYIQEDFKTWDEAYGICQLKRAHLVYIETFNENFLLSTIIRNQTRYWIGLNDLNTTGEFTWEDAKPFGDVPPNLLSSGEGISEEIHRCVYLTNGGTWWRTACSWKCSLICEAPKTGTSIPSHCPLGFFWHFVIGSCYAPILLNYTWAEATATCQSMNADIVSIDTLREWLFVRAISPATIWARYYNYHQYLFNYQSIYLDYQFAYYPAEYFYVEGFCTVLQDESQHSETCGNLHPFTCEVEIFNSTNVAG